MQHLQTHIAEFLLPMNGKMLEDFETFKSLESAGFIKMKSGEIKHYLTGIKKSGRYDSILISKEDYINNGDVFKASQ